MFFYLNRGKCSPGKIKFHCHENVGPHILTPYVSETKIADFANCIDLDEVAHNEPPHLDLNCLPSSL